MAGFGGEGSGGFGDDEVFTTADNGALGEVKVDAVEVPVAEVDVDNELVVEFDEFEGAVVTEGVVVDFVEDDSGVAGGVRGPGLRGSMATGEK